MEFGFAVRRFCATSPWDSMSAQNQALCRMLREDFDFSFFMLVFFDPFGKTIRDKI